MSKKDPQELFQFGHSFGYDCQKWYNLCICDENTIAWAAGSFLTFYDVKNKAYQFQRSSTGGNIGHITKNYITQPNHIAVGEGGFLKIPPKIIIKEWPSMSIVTILIGGTEYTYTNLDYSANGTLLASIGGPPDFNLTIWDWKNGRIKLSTCSHTSPVYNVEFSPYIQDQIVTCGNGHIRFWKMSKTFTGLKLQGVIGRFGKTDISDILGILAMPDETVLSGCSWGNILIWENGLIKFEVSRKGRKSCHDAPITQFMRCSESGEITTIGLDGHICTWGWSTVEQAVPADDVFFVELNPITEKYISNTKLVNIYHKQGNEWFAQDASGGIWIVDIGADNGTGLPEELNAERIICSHGGSIVGIALLPFNSYVVTLGSDGSFLIHELPNGPSISIDLKSGAASCLLHLPEKVNKSGNILVLGFCNGKIKLIFLNTESINKTESNSFITHLQELKPHTKSITVITINEKINILLTASSDSTIFAYEINVTDLIPILIPLYFIDTHCAVNSIDWNPQNEYTILIAGSNGFIIEGTLPKISEPKVQGDVITYKKEFIECHTSTVKTLKLYERIAIEIEEHNLAAEYSKLVDKNIKHDETEVDLVAENNKSENKAILWAKYDKNDSSQALISQEDCNCILRIRLGENEINAYGVLNGNMETSITQHVYMSDDKHVLGMNSGEIAVVSFSAKNDEEYDNKSSNELKQREKHLKIATNNHKLRILPVLQYDLVYLTRFQAHDCETGKITHMVFCPNKKYFYSTGADGNIFTFQINDSINIEPESKDKEEICDRIDAAVLEKISIKDSSTDTNMLTHEEYVQEKEKNLREHAAAEHKANMKNKLKQLKIEFDDLLAKNKTMPEKQQITMEENPRVQDFIDSELEKQMQILHRRLAYPLEVSNIRLQKMKTHYVDNLDVFPFQLNSILNPGFNVKIIRQKKLPESFYEEFDFIKNKILTQTAKTDDEVFETPQNSMESEKSDDNLSTAKSLETEHIAPLLRGLPTSPPPSRPLAKAIQNYLYRLERQRTQDIEWQKHLSTYVLDKTSGDNNGNENVADECFLNDQSEDDYPKTSMIQIQMNMYATRKEIYDIQRDFNKSLVQLRNEKIKLVEKFQNLSKKLKVINLLLPNDLIKPNPYPIPKIDDVFENTEKNVEIISSISKIVETHEKNTIDQEFEEILSLQTNSDKSHELQKRQITILLTEQSNILNEMKNIIENWEKSLKDIGRMRERIMLQAQFLKIHLLQLMREKLVLEPYESREDSMMERIYIFKNEIQDLQDQIATLQKGIDSKRSTILSIIDQQKQIEQDMYELIDGNRFTAFLKRVFKKKPKSTKQNDDSNESSSSSSSSSDEEEDSDSSDGLSKSGMSRIRLDSTSCPPGCDPQIFEEIVNLRSIRHQLDSKIRDEEKQIDITNKNMDIKNKVLKELSEKLQLKQNELKDLMKEKQTLLNDIECVVILKANQCIADALKDMKIKEGALVFPGAGIQSLQNRVHDLLKEAEEQKKKLSMNKNHLKRMHADCTYMNKRIISLKSNIEDILTQKLGVIDKKRNTTQDDNGKQKATKILDAVLQNMTHQFKLTTAIGLTKEMENQLLHWKKKQYELEQQYCTALQEHTSKLRTVTALQAEMSSYKDYKKVEISFNRREDEYVNDLVRLRRIRKEQQTQIEELRSEVQRLKLKPYTTPLLPPITPTNMSISPSAGISPPPFDLPTNISSASIIATNLAREINEVERELSGKTDSTNTIITAMAQLFPVLIEGKIDVNEAASKIIDSYKLKKGSDEKNYRQSVTYKKSQRTIAEILSQITKQNLKFADIEIATALETDDIKTESGSEIQFVIKELLEAGISPENTEAIDVAVSALIKMAPHVTNCSMNIDEIICSMQDRINIDPEQLKDMTTAVTECLSAQVTENAEVNSVAAECLEELQRSLVNPNEDPTTNFTLPQGMQSISISNINSQSPNSDKQGTKSEISTKSKTKNYSHYDKKK